ncbi:hypothetical protein [Dyella silvatica]|uniref:hypothetical protein n=1 Tax=Dyella silvatica TaxID=2992128 RepID=UPI002256AAE3|nr:hypothetical protein [Dyella silvatica]
MSRAKHAGDLVECFVADIPTERKARNTILGEYLLDGCASAISKNLAENILQIAQKQLACGIH